MMQEYFPEELSENALNLALQIGRENSKPEDDRQQEA
jgi:hypothetical protein